MGRIAPELKKRKEEKKCIHTSTFSAIMENIKYDVDMYFFPRSPIPNTRSRYCIVV